MHNKIIGHKKQLEQLNNDITQNNLSHAYLFSGPAQIGKFTIAKHLSKQLQCQDKNCPSSTKQDTTKNAKFCPTCQQIEKGQHFDTIELLDDEHSIKIATIRETIKRINMSSQSKYSCILIKNIERMTIAASNCLLKSLEEPPQKTIFFLTTSSASSILDTIISRSRQISFQHIPEQEILSALKKNFPEKTSKEISTAISLSTKKPGKAINFLENPENLETLIELNNSINSLFNNPTIAQRFKIIEKIAEDHDKTLKFLNLFNLQLHQKLLTASTPQTQTKYHQLLQSSLNIPKLLNQNVNTRLLFENLMLAL